MQKIALGALSLVSLGLVMVSGASVVKPLDFSPLVGSSSEATTTLSAATTGTFVTVEPEHPTSGKACIVTENGQSYVVLDTTFNTVQEPDTQVVLYRGNVAPLSLDDGSYETLGTLQSFDGAQRYEIPADVDIAVYQSVAIWDREFNVTFGYAPL